ncbi:MAG TPA: hypothetical protein PLF00_09470 [Candidatus Marinimicrobia bacterium]|nr:hypothetical protein [Candidatus Neomarinimicrobiota bacterium]
MVRYSSPKWAVASVQAKALLSHQARYGLSPYSATERGRLLSSPLGRTEATDYSHPLLIFYFP